MFTVVRIVQKVECTVADLFVAVVVVVVVVVVVELLKFRMHMFPLMIQILGRADFRGGIVAL